ncbi:MAG TPA: hypothetical protein DDY52_04640, partial [Candidatus Moranbacteria bacterium]|nr:hypothetical protein [Candidatus Moranbacteria bacterium]
SAQLAGVISDETGVGGNLVFSSNPTLAGLNSSETISVTGGDITSNQYVIANSATGGIQTRVSTGVPTDSANNGTMVVDSTNGRMYFRYGNAWHYVNQTGGFQIPNYEIAPYEQIDSLGKEAAKYALPFEENNFPDYLTDKMSPGDLLIPYVDSYLSDGAVHGLYARFIDVKDLMLEDTEREIGQLKNQNEDLLTKSNQSVSTLAELQKIVDENIDIISGRLDMEEENIGTYSDQIEMLLSANETNSMLLKDLQEQVDIIKQQNQALIEFTTALNMDSLIYKDASGNLTLSDGNLEAKNVFAGAFGVKIIDEDSKTIGSNYIEIENESNDGKSFIVKTKAVTESCVIFTSFQINPNAYSWVEKIKDEDGEYVGFKINLSEKTSQRIYFDWWIVEKQNSKDPIKSTEVTNETKTINTDIDGEILIDGTVVGQ